MDAKSTFREKAPWIMALLIRDFTLDLLSSAAIVGNLGHESNGFTTLQETNPSVPGSKGGWGWAQWTGPRRRAFEAYCTRNKLSPASDKANYGWLFNELSSSESAAINRVKMTEGLAEKVKAFEASFERSGVPHYESRNIWAMRALDAYADSTVSSIKLPSWVGKK